jgi:hypothetical protein
MEFEVKFVELKQISRKTFLMLTENISRCNE